MFGRYTGMSNHREMWEIKEEIPKLEQSFLTPEPNSLESSFQNKKVSAMRSHDNSDDFSSIESSPEFDTDKQEQLSELSKSETSEISIFHLAGLESGEEEEAVIGTRCGQYSFEGNDKPFRGPSLPPISKFLFMIKI